MSVQRWYIAIDLKSFFASVECVSRGLDPLTANLVVADSSRSDKTICLAVTPSLKALGVPGRPRLFEVKQIIGQLNEKTWPPVEYITATPRMAEYIRVSNMVYETYLKYISPDDIHVYSIDEVFIDATPYLMLYKCTPHELAMRMIQDVLARTGITATAGIGTNMYLAKVAMDIVAKHIPADKDGVRIAELDEMSYREKLWSHTPITDFWRVGAGIAKRLAKYELYTMGDIARCSMGVTGSNNFYKHDFYKHDFYNEELLYKEFGINAELLIDHAWGYEDCLISDVKAYKPKNQSLSNGQVLPHGYTFENTKIVVKEMAEELAFTLVSRHLVTNQVALYIGYDIENLRNAGIKADYTSKCGFNVSMPIKTETDHWGREIPGSAGGRAGTGMFTSSGRLISAMAEQILEKITPEPCKSLLVRRINISALNIMTDCAAAKLEKENLQNEQPDLFGEFEKVKQIHDKVRQELEKELSIQESVLEMKHRYGKNAVFKGMDLQSEATTLTRNAQIGGHKA